MSMTYLHDAIEALPDTPRHEVMLEVTEGDLLRSKVLSRITMMKEYIRRCEKNGWHRDADECRGQVWGLELVLDWIDEERGKS